MINSLVKMAMDGTSFQEWTLGVLVRPCCVLSSIVVLITPSISFFISYAPFPAYHFLALFFSVSFG
jgi:hypothetical protein